MKKHIAKLSMLTLCAAAILAVPALSRAQDTTNAPVAAPLVPPPAPPPAAVQTPPPKKHIAAPAAPASLPFHGALTAVDTNAMTLTVEKRTFEITSATIITKDGKPAVLADGVVGEQVRGSYKKSTKGKLDAVMVRFVGATEGRKKLSAGN